ncbi:MAG: hypothetical protein ACKVU4_05225 [Phycisphaerales bacterium]
MGVGVKRGVQRPRTRSARIARPKPVANEARRGEPLLGGIGDAAVRKATGRGWGEWLAILDAAGARRMTHAQIAEHLHEHERVGDWWSQMVTVGYEQARGLRVKYQSSTGVYRGSASRTIGVPVSVLYAAWSDAKLRKRWLGRDAAFTVRTATKNTSMRITWTDGASNVEAMFAAKGPGKSQVAVQHSRLSDAKGVERIKAFWGARLDTLRRILEG